MDKRVREMVDKCIACQSVENSNNRTPTEEKTWNSIAIDFHGPITRTGK